MLKTTTFTTFHDAYLAVLRHVSDQPEYRNAPRDNAARECLNVTFTLTNPRDRIVYAPGRRTNIVFCYAEALWYLLGRDDLDMIGYYAPRLSKVSDDGVCLTGTAYGPKLFRRQAPDLPSQWEQVSELLNTDPATKRAVVAFFHPAELEEPDNPDVSCTIALQFLLRDGRLHAVVYMRGNDAVTGLLCDVFSFTLIQEFAAYQLGVQVGGYAHHVGSMHINDIDASRVVRVLTAEQQRPSFPAVVMPPTSWDDLGIVELYEQALRHDEDRLHPEGLDRLGLEPYWQQVVLLLEIYRQITHYPSDPVEPSALQALEPGYRWLIAHRWPDRMPTGFAPTAGDQQ